MNGQLIKPMDRVFYRELYDRYASIVYNTIYRMVQHSAEAEDLMQETFVTAFQKIHLLKNQDGFEPWVKRIAINKALESLRKRKINFSEYQEELIEDRADTSLIDEAAFEFKVEEVKRAIASLPAGYRTIVQLYLFEDLSQEEIAVLLGISHVTVRTQYHRAKNRILKDIKKGGEK